jgi:hypothetical protein
MSFTSLTVIETAGKITVETLEDLLSIMTSPWAAYTYCDAVGVPPFPVPGEWAPTIRQLRQKADAAKDPEQWAEIISLASQVITGLQSALRNAGGPSPGPVETAIIKVLVPLLRSQQARQSPSAYAARLGFFRGSAAPGLVSAGPVR